MSPHDSDASRGQLRENVQNASKTLKTNPNSLILTPDLAELLTPMPHAGDLKLRKEGCYAPKTLNPNPEPKILTPDQGEGLTLVPREGDSTLRRRSRQGWIAALRSCKRRLCLVCPKYWTLGPELVHLDCGILLAAQSRRRLWLVCAKYWASGPAAHVVHPNP